MSKFKVGDKVRCINGTGSGLKLVSGCEYIVEECDSHGISLCGVPITHCFWYTDRFELVEEAPVAAKQPTFDLRDTKINVKAYAEKNGITLENAHKEIQSWLFDQGYSWNIEGVIFLATYSSYLYIMGEELLHGGSEHHFYEGTPEKEITLSRQVVLTPSYVEEELVEFGGKMYNKREFLSAIANVKEKTNE